MRASVKIRLSLVAACLLASPLAMAQRSSGDYPQKPVTIIIPYAGSSSIDTEIRLYTQSILESTGKQFLNDYKSGAGTTIGAAYVAKAVPDGYTLLATNSPFSIAPLVYPSLTYDNIRDFSPISLLSKSGFLLVAYPGAPFKNIAEYIAYARANPGVVNWGTAGSGGSSHLVGEWLHSDTKTKVTFVHYKAPQQRVLDAMAGRVDIVGVGVAAATGFLKAGKLRALGVTSIQRIPIMPDLPTVAEQGVPGFDFATWSGLLAPARTPPAIIATLNALFVKATKEPGTIRKLEADGSILVGSSPEQLRQHLIQEADHWRKLVAEAGIKMEAD